MIPIDVGRDHPSSSTKPVAVVWLFASSGDQTPEVTGSVILSRIPSILFAKGMHVDAKVTTVANVACPAQLLTLPELDSGVDRPPLEPPPSELY
jgi:hypothetical protein